MSIHASIHIQTSNTQRIRAILESTPGSNTFIANANGWVSVFPEELETLDLNDAKPLTQVFHEFGLTFVCVGEDNEIELWDVTNQDIQHINHTELQTTSTRLGIPPHCLTHFDALTNLQEDNDLPNEFTQIEREPEKPGMAAFFGRSSDE